MTVGPIQGDGGAPGVVCCWPWSDPLGPQLNTVRRNRLGREVDAAEEVGCDPRAELATVERPRAFAHFTLVPGTSKDPWAPRYLGRVLARGVRRMILIDPYALHDDHHSGALDRFLRHLRLANGAQARVKTSRARPKVDSWTGARENPARVSEEQQKRRVALLKDRSTWLSITIVEGGFLEEHDRPIVLHTADDGYYRILLGHGLFGFEPACRRRSEGVWFEITREDFEADWAEARPGPGTR